MSGRVEHVLHSFIDPKLYKHMSFRSVSLHHCYFLNIKTYLSINPFVNLLSLNVCDLRSKAHKIVFCLSHVLNVHLSSSQQKHTRKLTYTAAKHCSLHKHFFHHSAYTQPYSSVSRTLLSALRRANCQTDRVSVLVLLITPTHP
jgi:hypothetical protein